LTEKDIQVPMATLESFNAAELDETSPRLSFIQDPVRLALECKGLTLPDFVELPIHPEHPELGSRNWPLPADCGLEVFIERDDYKAAISGDGRLRLKDFADIHLDPHQGGEVVQLEKADGVRIVHWLVAGVERPAVMWRPDESGEWSKRKGLLETSGHGVGQVVQLERVGFARIDGLPASNDPTSSTDLIWTHG
jgi:glutamyl/glutaminyl-tRNA synthetase